MTVTCNYCSNEAQKLTGLELYRMKSLQDKSFWVCRPCGAHVGCHPDGTPLGPLANLRLRAARQAAHAAFDPIWKSNKQSRRSDAYGWLAEKMELTRNQTHIGKFNVSQCLRVVELCLREGPYERHIEFTEHS